MNFPPPLALHAEDEDEVTFGADILTGLKFTIKGRTVRIFPLREARGPSMPITHRITQLGIVDRGLYSCIMRGSDGSRITIYLTDADLEHNRQLVRDAVDHVLEAGLCA